MATGEVADPTGEGAKARRGVTLNGERTAGAGRHGPGTPHLPVYAWSEILRHDQAGDFWIVIGGAVYDVSKWMDEHPGGADELISAWGKDAGDLFGAIGHSDEALARAQTFRIGWVDEGSAAPRDPGTPRISMQRPQSSPVPVPDAADGPLEIPWAVRWLAPKGERFTNFDILNDNDSQLEYYRRFGHIYAVGIPTKKWRLVVVSDPELLEEVATNDAQFGKRVDDINFFDQLAGSRGGGISVAGDGDHYNRIRRVMLPWYAPSHQKTQFGLMKEQAKGLLDAWGSLGDDTPVDLREWGERYALEISGRGACLYDFGVLNPHAEKSSFAAAVTESTKESIARIVEPRPDFTLFSGRSKRERKKKYHRQSQLIFSTAESIVTERLACPVHKGNDLLSRLISVPDPESGEKLDPETIRDQILMHLSNGFNGPSITLAWLGYLLATHPDVEEKLIAEIDSITGGDPEYELQYPDLMRLPYTTQVIKETLRIYPPMPVTIRRSLKDGMLGPYRIRKDDIILVGALAAQRDPRYWGPNADRFDPDQFQMEKVVERPRHAFIPFSVGQRQCMAQEVSFMMLRIALFEIYNRYRLRLAPGTSVVKNTAATTKPAKVTIIRVPREGIAERRVAIAERAAQEVEALGLLDEVDRRAWDCPSKVAKDSPFRHLVIAYGSNFGTSKELAERFADRSRYFGHTCEVLALDGLVDREPPDEPWLLIVMTATYTGNPPVNATTFKAWLEATSPGSDLWRNCRYLVWGVGNSQWNSFMAFPRYVHRKLEELGAQPLENLSYGDVGSPLWEELHTAWNDRVWPMLREMVGAEPCEYAAAEFASEQAAIDSLMALDSIAAMRETLDGTAPEPVLLTNAVGITTSTVRAIACVELQAPESSSRTRHLEVSLPNSFTYACGDHLGVCPQNSHESVERLADQLGAPLDAVLVVPTTMNARAVPRGIPLQVRNVLTCLLDITSLPTLAMLDLLIAKAGDANERMRLMEIRSVLATPDGDPSPVRDAVRAGGYSILHLLDDFPSVSLNIFEFLQVAQPLRPRYYSISSCPRIHGNSVAHVSVGARAVPVPGIPGRHFQGMCSRYVQSLPEEDYLNVFLDRAEGFHLQDDPAKPMIFVSAGTGYAPMRAFLWERLAMRREGVVLGPAALFNGIRSSALDYIYRDEIEMFADEGVLDHLHVAMSREVPGKREYVQHRIEAVAPLVWELVQDGAYVYVCGSQVMRDDVRAAFVSVFALQGAMTVEETETFMQRLEVERRYRPDIWG